MNCPGHELSQERKNPPRSKTTESASIEEAAIEEREEGILPELDNIENGTDPEYGDVAQNVHLSSR